MPPSLSRWLDSSKTLYEQDVKEHDVLYLRFKYYSFMDIDPRVSQRRWEERAGQLAAEGLLSVLDVPPDAGLIWHLASLHLPAAVGVAITHGSCSTSW